jgi:hypothetical protein
MKNKRTLGRLYLPVNEGGFNTLDWLVKAGIVTSAAVAYGLNEYGMSEYVKHAVGAGIFLAGMNFGSSLGEGRFSKLTDSQKDDLVDHVLDIDYQRNAANPRKKVIEINPEDRR